MKLSYRTGLCCISDYSTHCPVSVFFCYNWARSTLKYPTLLRLRRFFTFLRHKISKSLGFFCFPFHENFYIGWSIKERLNLPQKISNQTNFVLIFIKKRERPSRNAPIPSEYFTCTQYAEIYFLH